MASTGSPVGKVLFGHSQMSLDSVLASMSGVRPPLGSEQIEDQPERRSLLNEALHGFVGRFCPGESRIRDEFENYTSQFITGVPLFVGGTRGMALSAALYGLNQAKAGDSTEHKLIDFGLGALKGAGTKWAFDRLGAKKSWNFAAKGVAMGASARGFEVGLSRENWFDRNGKFTPISGVYSTGSSMFHPLSLATDIVTFGSAHYGIKYADALTKGAIQASPRLQHLVTGTTFGFTSGALGEVQRQLNDPHGHFDPLAIIGRGGVSALTMSAAAASGFGLTARGVDSVVQPKTESFTAFNRLKGDLSRIRSLLSGKAVQSEQASSAVVETSEEVRRPLDQTTHHSPSLEPGAAADHPTSFEHLSLEERRDVVRRQLETLEPASRDWADLTHSRRPIYDYWQARDQLAQELARQGMPVGDGSLETLMRQRRTSGVASEQEILLDDELTRLKQLDANAITTFEQRLCTLQNSVNQSCTENGKPPCHLVVSELSPLLDGAYDLGRNEITIRFNDLLAPDSALRVRESLVHELVHHAQDLLIIRSIAQALGVTAPASGGENQSSMQNLLDVYEDRTGYPLNRDFATEVLRTYQSSAPLTEQEMIHAGNLAESIRTFDQNMKALNNQITGLAKDAGDLQNDPSNVVSFLERVVSSEGERLRCFGTTDLQWIMALKTARGLWPANKVTLAEKVTDRLMEHCEQLDQQRTTLYRSALHEQSPWQSSDVAAAERR